MPHASQGFSASLKLVSVRGLTNKHDAWKEWKGLSLVSRVGPGGDERRENGLGTKEGEAACGPGVSGVGRVVMTEDSMGTTGCEYRAFENRDSRRGSSQ